jgi:antitoxin component of MazEF toxin-antitoxin module
VYKGTVKIGKNGNSRTITIPRPLAETLKWEVGDEIKLELHGQNDVRLRRIVRALTCRQFTPRVEPIDLTDPRQAEQDES